MQILDNLIILLLIVASFMSGMTIANKYNKRSEEEKRNALERQFLRLKAKVDADDPCRPYAAPGYKYVPPAPLPNTGDYDGDPPPPINTEFMDRLKQNGRAAVKINKADLAKGNPA